MKSKHNTIFGQILQLIPRYNFEKAVKQSNSEKASKGFSSWTHFVSLLLGQLSGQTGLRGIVSVMESQVRKLYHLGVRPTIRSTLSYANNHRPHKLFELVFASLLTKTLSAAPQNKFRFKNPLYSIDASTINLCLSLYDWAKFRKTKAGIKLHIKLDHKGYIPRVAVITEAKRNDVTIGREFNFEKDDIIVFDRGYNDYKFFASLCIRGSYFVTRLKKNADYRVIERRDVSGYKNISSDQIIKFNGFYAQKKCPLKLRRIRSRDPKTGKWIVLLTNNLHWSPKTIAAIYKDRWQIECFFKTIKQTLKIKSFLGTSENAVHSQIWVALIAYLLMSYLKFKSKMSWTVYQLMQVIPVLLFIRCELWSWLNKLFDEQAGRAFDQPELDWR